MSGHVTNAVCVGHRQRHRRRHPIIFTWAAATRPYHAYHSTEPSIHCIDQGGGLWTAVSAMYRLFEDNSGTHIQVRTCTALYSFFVRRSYVP